VRRSAAILACVLASALVGGVAASGSRSPSVPRPRIVWKPIPFGPKRRAEMAAYALRHYGLDTWRLVRPRVIVEHMSVASSFSSVYSSFAPDVPDYELHELPGLCAHFVVDRDGTIYQLVPLGTMCRHAVGLNWTAIGIEHVGFADADVLGDARQLDASLRLTLWLEQRFHIPLRDVIGHNESVTSPYHRERIASLRCQTHADWRRADMAVYRRDLARLARRYGVAVGPPPGPPRPTGC
jgi:N-acetylmuramoyl-L-alanine amidase